LQHDVPHDPAATPACPVDVLLRQMMRSAEYRKIGEIKQN
jgi:hypothetical protein